MKRLVLPVALRDRLVAAARAAGEDEICGLIAGRGEHCSELYPVKNVSPTPETAFYMDPQMQIDAMMAMERRGESMLAIYHSHPRSAASPSARDLAGAAYPGVAWVIISLEDRGQPALGAFSLDGGTASALELVVD